MRMNTSGKLGHTVLKWIFSSNLFFCFRLLHYSIYIIALACLCVNLHPPFLKLVNFFTLKLRLSPSEAALILQGSRGKLNSETESTFDFGRVMSSLKIFTVCLYPYTFSENTVIPCVCNVNREKGFSWHAHEISCRWVCRNWGQKLIFRPCRRVGRSKYIK